MSKLSHSNPDLDDVYVDGDEYRFENGGAYVKPEPEPDADDSIPLTKEELIKIYDDLELHWHAYMLTKDAEDEWYETKVGDRVFDINICEVVIVSDTVKCADAILYECFMDNDSWKTNTEKEYKLIDGRYYKEITEWQSNRSPKKRKLRERVGY